MVCDAVASRVANVQRLHIRPSLPAASWLSPRRPRIVGCDGDRPRGRGAAAALVEQRTEI